MECCSSLTGKLSREQKHVNNTENELEFHVPETNDNQILSPPLADWTIQLLVLLYLFNFCLTLVL